jgi:uncharacterized protein YegL
MTLISPKRDACEVADELSPNASNQARTSPRRADRLREFILGHLPHGISVDVIIGPGVETAAVLPADVDAVLSSDATDLERAQVTQLLADVDADYLVLVTGAAADLERIPLNDQLTADHAHQFGLVFHELLHILKTAIIAISDLLEAEVDSQYHEQVHDLINLVEDGAIESEAIHGENFSDNAGIRLELTRRLHSATPADIPDGGKVRYSFWDAVTTCLYDEAIYPTGTTAVLLDETDERITFASDADEQAFESIHGCLVDLAHDALAIRSAERDDTTHSHDKTASIHRARLVINLWNQHIQPLLERDKDEGEEGNTDSGSVHQDADGEEASKEQADSGDGAENRGGNQTASIGPQDPSLSRDATEDPHQDIFEQPQITDDPDLSEVPDNPEPPADETTGTPAGGGTEDISGTAIGQAGEESEAERDEPASRAAEIAQVIDQARAEDTDQAGEQTSSTNGDSPRESGIESTPGQTSLGDFEPSNTEQPAETGQTDNADNTDKTDNTDTPDSPEGPDGGKGQSSTGNQADREEGASAEEPTQTATTAPQHDGPAHAQSTAQSNRDERERFEEALAHDERAAHDEAAQGELDQHGLEQELEDIAQQLNRAANNQTQQSETTASEAEGASGNRGGQESLTEIEILPIGDDTVAPREWDSVEQGADQVGGTLETYLRLERQKGERTGLTTGSYDTRAGHRLAIGDPRVCKSAIPGGEKQYAVVFVLDRSYSMRHGSPQKIDVATQALARFALATEQLGINVAVIDFIHGDARLVKPFSVETRHVQAALLDTSTGGGTPLADALGIAQTLIENQRDEPLIIAVTDDQPSDVDAVKSQIRASHAPVCSLTIATDQQPGTLPDDANELSQFYERQEAVYSPERLDDRLDQFASLLAGL